MMHWDASGDSDPELVYDPSDFASTPTAYGSNWQLGGGPGGAGGALRQRAGWRYRGSMLGDNAWAMSWDCVVNSDPFIDATISITNRSSLF